MKVLYREHEVGRLDFLRWLALHDTPLEVDIGCNTGVFLATVASRFPHRRFLGVELVPHLAAKAAARITGKKLTNVRIVNGEAAQLCERYLLDRSVSVVHIYFPTPYPGAFGLRQRLLQMKFVTELERLVVRWGSVRLATDHDEYFRAACALFANGAWWAVPWVQLSLGQPLDLMTGTPCEYQYAREQGRAVLLFHAIRNRGRTAYLRPVR